MERAVAFVTGGASGLGRAIALRLAADGMAVAIGDIDEAGGASVVHEIEAAGGVADAIRCDVSELDALVAAAHRTRDRFGGVHVLVNNAGFDIPGFFLESDPSTWHRLLAVNLVGVLNATYAFGPLLTQQASASRYARIVNVASDAGRVGSLGEAVYSAAKGGVIAFTKSMARELARDRVTVNAVCPGPADTPMTSAIRETELGAKLMERMVQATPFKRLVQPDEVAAAVSYFASDDARFVTAQVLSVSGGLTIPG